MNDPKAAPMSDSGPMTKLTQADYDRFHRLAPNVLKDRGPGYFFGELDSSIYFLLAGAIPTVGVVYWGWSATNWLVLLVAGCWMGLICDCVRMYFLKKEIKKYCDRIVDDTFVSVIAEAIRGKKDEVVSAHIPSAPDYTVAVFVDLIFCSVSSFVILVSLPERLDANLMGRSWFLPSPIGILAYRLLMMIWEIVEHRNQPRRKPVVKLALGLRGASMFVVMFIVLISFDEVQDSTTASYYVVYGVNGLLILIGAMNLYGLFLMISETRWLRKYLKSRES